MVEISVPHRLLMTKGSSSALTYDIELYHLTTMKLKWSVECYNKYIWEEVNMKLEICHTPAFIHKVFPLICSRFSSKVLSTSMRSIGFSFRFKATGHSTHCRKAHAEGKVVVFNTLAAELDSTIPPWLPPSNYTRHRKAPHIQTFEHMYAFN